MEKLLFWVLWAYLSKSFLRNQKLTILGTLGMRHHPHQTQQNQLEGNFYVYLPEKISF